MSSTNRSGEGRIALDAYYTPDALASACVSVVPFSGEGLVLEPSVGGGAFARAVRARWPRAFVTGLDANPEAPGRSDVHYFVPGDALAWRPMPPPNLIVGNPPYTDAEAHVQWALDTVAQGGTVGMLLRLAFLETKKRRAFWARWGSYLDTVYVLAERPSFLANGKHDSCAYGWFVWRKAEGCASRVVPAWSGRPV